MLRAGGSLVALSLITALISQYGFGLLPCDLCLLQRYPAYAAIAIWMLYEALKKPRLMLYGFTLACLTTAAIALYHTGVEQAWWKGPSSCSGDDAPTATLSLEQLKAQILATPLIQCNKPAIEIWGITMASANFIFSSIIALMSIVTLLNSRKGTSHA